MKGGGGVEVAFNRHLTRKLTLTARHDVMQLGAGQNALTESNILSSILSRGDQRLSMVNRGEAVYEHEWCHGVSTFAGARMRRIFANRYVPIFAARRCARQLGFRRRGARRPAALEKRNGLPHALRQAVDGFGLPHPDARILGGDSRRAARRLRILPPRRRHPLPSGTAARGVFRTSRCRAGASSARSPYQLLKLHEGNGTYFYDPTPSRA